MKIKAIPIKSITLCGKCRFGLGNECKQSIKCKDCKMHRGGNSCRCDLMKKGKRCEHFERYEEEKHIGLKPCPFCGGDAKIVEIENDTDYQRLKIECLFCGATLERTQDFAHSQIARIALNESAIDVWNRRDGDV